MMTRRGLTLIELLVVIAIIGLLVAMLLPAVQSARESARRLTCTNRLRELGLAVHSYHDASKQLPPFIHGNGSTNWFDENGHSWASLVLPHLELASLYDQIDFTKGAIHEANRVPLRTVAPVFLCPSTVRLAQERPTGNPHVYFGTFGQGTGDIVRGVEFAVHDYMPTVQAGISYKEVPDPTPDGAWGEVDAKQRDDGSYVRWTRRLRFVDIIDGLSQTTLFAESAGLPDVFWDSGESTQRGGDRQFRAAAWLLGAGNWMIVLEEGRTAINGRNDRGIYSFHPKGANAVMCDGSVHFLNMAIDKDVLAALISREGGEVISAKDWQ